MLKPRVPIRRFDVFAEYSRQEAIKKGMPPDEAEGYGLWVAKVVASRGFGRGVKSGPAAGGGTGSQAESESEQPKKPEWHTLESKPQTDELFHEEIVKRMGKEFYETIFMPAIEEALREDRSYTSIRDTVRRDWKP